eukprot:gene21224-8023_t
MLMMVPNRFRGVANKVMLDLKGCKCDWVKDGEDALDRLNDHIYDVVLVEMNTPDGALDGGELAVRIRAVEQLMGHDAPHTPIIAMLTRDECGDELLMRRCVESGIDRYLLKPFGVHVKTVVENWQL